MFHMMLFNVCYKPTIYLLYLINSYFIVLSFYENMKKFKVWGILIIDIIMFLFCLFFIIIL